MVLKMFVLVSFQPLWLLRLLVVLLGYVVDKSWGFFPPHQSQYLKLTVSSSLRSIATKTDSPTRSVDDESSSSSSQQPQSAANSSAGWDSFDYEHHWYPVSWVCDLKPFRRPHRVTLFDVDYVVAVDHSSNHSNKNHDHQQPHNDGVVVIAALRDVCPHKAAALSEGRITSTGLLQCAYHGWSFDGVSGNCQQIPQAATAATSTTASSSKNYSASQPPPPQYSSRTCAQAIPAVIHQGLLWLWPGRPRDHYPSPPSIPQIDDANFRVLSRSVRDFPMVDWTLLVSNILDPDHGLFAHQAPAFDWYSADPEHPLVVEESFPNAGWRLQSSVPAVEKLLRRDKDQRATTRTRLSLLERGMNVLANNKKQSHTVTPVKSPQQQQLLATSVFEAPTTIALFRRQVPEDGGPDDVKFVTAFWVCPVGVGRSRFLAAAVTRNVPAWFKVPRWLNHVTLNAFLDQDTVLVASQQGPVLSAELAGTAPRSKLFAYASPTDRIVRRIDQFWDATVGRSPNRAAGLRRVVAQSSKLLPPAEDRRIVLDRQIQHLSICPDSQDAVRNFRRIRNVAAVIVTTWMGWVWKQSATLTTAAVSSSVTTTSITASTILARKFWPVAVLAALVGAVCETVRRQFYFNYPEWKRDRDLRSIPAKTWLDPK